MKNLEEKIKKRKILRFTGRPGGILLRVETDRSRKKFEALLYPSTQTIHHASYLRGVIIFKDSSKCCETSSKKEKEEKF